MISFRRQPEHLPLATLQEALSGPWSEYWREAHSDDIDANGWISLPQRALGELHMRRGHAAYPDGLRWVDVREGASDTWVFLIKPGKAGRLKVEAHGQPDLAHKMQAVTPDDAPRYALVRQRFDHLVAGIRALNAGWIASLEWTERLNEQANEAADAPWQRWWAHCRAMQALAGRRGWRVTPLRATPPATEAELAAVEQAHGVRIPAQLRQLLGEVAADVHFGWRCSRDDEPRGDTRSLYSGGIRDTLCSLEMIDRYALGNFKGWREYFHGARSPERETEQPNPAALWENQFAFAHLINGDALTIDTTNPDPAAQPVRYFSHAADGMHGEVLASSLHAFFEAWCALGCAGNEQHDWWNLRDPDTGHLSAHGVVAGLWRDWLQRDPDQREPDQAPRPVLARSASDTAWLDAARAQDLEALQAALAQGAKVDGCPDDWQDENHTAVIYAVRNDNLPMLQWLHAQGASLSTTVLSTAVAVRHASPATLRWLIEHGARVNRWREQRFCPLHELMSSDRTSEDYRALMALLLQGGADPDAFYDLESIAARTTALMRAGPWTARRLLAAGADPHLRDLSGRTALHLAEDPEVIDLLVQAGLDPDDLSTPDDGEPGCTPLQFALRRDSADEAVPALLAAGADPHRTDTLGRHAWFYCFDAACVDLLLARGFDVNAQDGEGQTVLHHLLAYTQRLYGRYLETAERLLQRGLDLRLADAEGNTVLHRMASCCDSVHDHPSLEFLLQQGADRTLRNHQGQQAWQCVGRRHKAAAALLKPGA